MNKFIQSALILSTLVFAAPLAAQAAEPGDAASCQDRLKEVRTDWQNSPIPTSRARAMNIGSGRNHDHAAMVTNYMEGEMAKAERLCQSGQDHEALLHLDVVRAWLRLPYEEHPAAHQYHLDKTAR